MVVCVVCVVDFWWMSLDIEHKMYDLFSILICFATTTCVRLFLSNNRCCKILQRNRLSKEIIRITTIPML